MMPTDATAQVVPSERYTPRVAIVTGGTQGIGRGLVERLADDGIDIAVNDIPANQEAIDKVVNEVREKGRRAIALPGDVSVEADVIAMIEKTVNELGSVDIMVANAGIVPVKPFLETTVETFDKVLAINARGVFLCFKHSALQMIKQGTGGRLMAACSSAGRNGEKHRTGYSASKFAVRGIVQTASIELRKYGITVNSFAPGPTITAEQRARLDELKAKAPPEMLAEYANAPLAGPENHASLVSYLAKPESHFINGQTINVNGGFTFD